jgi:DNA polymerase III sliding clamp (beta) subunit (PCNA family)
MTDKITIQTKAGQLAAALTAVAKKDVRYFLQGVHFEAMPDAGVTTISTDGHRLMKIDSLLDKWIGPVPADDVIIEFDKETASAINKVGNRDSWVELVVDMEGSQVEVTLANTVRRATRVDAKYPDHERIIPKLAGELNGIEVEESSFNPAYLADLAKANKSLGDEAPVTLSPRGTGAMLVTFNGLASGIEALCVVMPMRL